MTDNQYLTLRNVTLSRSLGDQFVVLIKGVSFVAKKGEVLALLCEQVECLNLIIQSVMGALPPGIERVKGQVFYKKTVLSGLGAYDHRRICGDRIVVLGKHYLATQTVLEQFRGRFRWYQQRFSRQQLRLVVSDLLLRFGFEQPELFLDYCLHDLSTTQRMQVVLALALFTKPDVLIVSDLEGMDMAEQAAFVVQLSKLPNRDQMAIILSTACGNFARELADQVCFFYQGVLIESAPCVDFFTQPKTQAAQTWLSQYSKSRCVQKVGQKKVESLKILSVEDLCVESVLGPVSLSMYRGECLAVLAKKYVIGDAFFAAISGVGHLRGRLSGWYGLGRLKRDQKWALNKKRIPDFYQQVQFLNQHALAAINLHLRVNEQFVKFEPLFKKKGPEVEQRIGECLNAVGLGVDVRCLWAHCLTDDQRFALAQAQSLYCRPHLLVYQDDPTKPYPFRWTVGQKLLAVQKRLGSDLGTVLVTHDPDFAKCFASRLVKIG